MRGVIAILLSVALLLGGGTQRAAQPDEASSSDDRPALRMSPAQLVAIIDETGRGNYITSCVDILLDLEIKRIRLYASKPTDAVGTHRIEDYRVEVVYRPEWQDLERRAAGLYHLMYDGRVREFACASVAEGRRSFGLGLLKLCLRVDPEWAFTHPTGYEIVKLADLVQALERGEKWATEVVEAEAEQWRILVHKYKPRLSGQTGSSSGKEKGRGGPRSSGAH